MLRFVFAGLMMVVTTLLASDAPAINRDFVFEDKLEGAEKKAVFSARKLYEHASYLASAECNGRLAGSAGETKARAYIVARLLDAGFTDVRQFPFEFTGEVRMGEKNRLAQLPGNEYEVLTDFRPFPISKNGEGEAELVFAGFGISAPDKGYDDYAGLDVKGKIVLAFRGEPETPDGRHIGEDKADPHAMMSNVYGDLFYKAGVARDKGALALLIIDGERGKAPQKKVAPDLIRGGGRHHCGLPLIQVVTEVADSWLKTESKTAADLKKRISEKLVPTSFPVEKQRVAFRSDIFRERATDWNLAVVLAGQDPLLKDEIVVIGAHYDHLGTGNEFSLADKADMGKVHCGADDNASGVSSVLEIARVLAENKAKLKRTVWIMFFGAEEMGTLGSNAFVKAPPDDFKVARTAAMLNLDMVGRSRENRVMVYGAATGTGFGEMLKKVDEGIGLEIKTTADGFGGSDQTAFVTAGIPVLFFFTGSHSDYHKPSDTADKLIVDQQAKITALATRAALNLINAPERPKFVKVDTPKVTGGMGGVRLGLLPDYGFDGKGLRLSGVSNASPADKGGLKSGDIIIELGGHKVENIYDYMNALKQAKPDLPTPVVLIRDGKEMEVKVVPERKD